MTDRADPPEPPQADETARVAGRGGLALTFAKLYFILTGLVQQVLLPRVLGLDGYGALSSALGAASIAYNPVVTTSIQGVSRAVASTREEERPQALRRVLVVHAVLAVLLATGFFAGASLVTAFMRAPHLVAPLRVLSLVLLFYGLYSPLVGALNGTRRFVVQASFDVVFATLRTGALVAGSTLLSASGRGPLGAASGFVVVAALIAVAAATVVGVGRAGPGGPSVREHVGFVAPLLAGQVLLNLLLQADLTLLRRFAGEAAAAAGLPLTAADPLVGAYRATQLYSFLPYQLLVSVTFILFPMLATAAKERDRARIASYVATGVRVALLLAGLLVSVTSGLSRALLRLVYTDEAAVLGGRAMQVLTLGFGTFAILGVLSAVLSSLGKERTAAGIVGVAVSLVVVLGFVTVRGTAFGEPLLFRTALATSVGLVLATGWAAFTVRRTAGAVVSPLTVARVLFSLAVAIGLAHLLPVVGKLLTLVECAVVAGAYLALLVATRELGAADARVVRTILGGRK
ncbi:MAG TPA: oligosaccharide flippase family protein [Polyangiaceae bacterium]|nr:oligosaccharide flippase family protein [Polyangiaceae bacterium]